MSSNSSLPGNTRAPEATRPYIGSVARLRKREVDAPEEMIDRVKTTLEVTFGPGLQSPAVSYCSGSIGLMSEHTHYFDGFAFLMRLPFGSVAAARHSNSTRSQLVFSPDAPVEEFDVTDPIKTAVFPEGDSNGSGLIFEILRRMVPASRPVDIAIEVSVPTYCINAYVSSLALSVARAINDLFRLSYDVPTLLRMVRKIISGYLERPFSITYPLAAYYDDPGSFILVDAETLEHIHLGSPSENEISFGLFEAGTVSDAPAVFRKLDKKANELPGLLQDRGFRDVNTLRDLDHSDLQRALNVVPRSYKGPLRYLVTENRRVQKMVTAVRKNDWQMFGALLLMSNASLRNDWGVVHERADFIVERIESMSIEGMFGATMASRGRTVLAVGQPFTVPRCLEMVQSAYAERFGHEPEALVL